MSAEGTKKNLSILKAFTILEAMVGNQFLYKLQTLENITGMPASTITRFLNALIENGYVGKNESTSQYYLTLKITKLGLQVQRYFHLRDIVRPYLLNLSNTFSLSSNLAIEENGQVVYIDAVDGPEHILQSLSKIGKVAPMNCTGVGKLLLTNYKDVEIDEYFKTNKLKKLTPNSITLKSKLIAELDLIRKNQYALDNEECEIGAICVAVPIFNYMPTVVSSISLTGFKAKMTKPFIKELVTALKESSAKISQSLGWEQ